MLTRDSTIQYLMFHYTTLCGLLFLTIIMGVVLVGFLAYHVMLACNNTTTNESFKWRNLYYQIGYVQEQQAKNNVPEDRRAQMPDNVYDRGGWANFKEVFSPIASWKRGDRPPVPEPMALSPADVAAAKAARKHVENLGAAPPAPGMAASPPSASPPAGTATSHRKGQEGARRRKPKRT